MPRSKAMKPGQQGTHNTDQEHSSASTTHSSGCISSITASSTAAQMNNMNNAFNSPTPPASASLSSGASTPVQQQQAFKNPHDKKGRSTSCLLCQKRKQKCDHRLPSCTTCIKAGVKCIQPAKYNVKVPEKDEYTIMLEKKIKFLEKIVDVNAVKKNFKYKTLSPFLGKEETLQQSQPLPSQLLQHPSVDNKIIPIPTNRKLPMPNDELSKKAYLSIDTVDYSHSLFGKYNLKEFLKFDPVFEFDEKLSRAFLDIYFTRLQFKYPLLDEEEIFEFHNCYVSNNLSGYMNNNDYFHYCCCRMWMIFAISSCLHMTTGKYSGPPPARYFSTAIRHITKVSNINNYQKIEILTLAVLYLIRTDRDSVCLYEIIEDSLKLCVEMKLNKTSTYNSSNEKGKVSKLRLWWCVYLLERMITIAVGKPYSLSEFQVDLDLPLFESEPSAKAKHRRQYHHSHSLTNNNIFINQSIKLRRIESRFVEKFHIVGNNDGDDESQTINKDQLPLVEKFFQELEIWRGNCEGFSNGIENETLRLYYYRSVRLLIQPFLELMDPMDKLFRECQAAAGQICQLFKVFHEKTVFGHSTTAIHTVFVAGVTLVYCLWLARNKNDIKRKELGDVSKHTRPTVSEALFNGLNDLRACSICLYVMTERSKFALIFRDTFDQLMTATITNLIERCGPDSSELIYNPKEPGMPPAVVRRAIQENSAGGFGSVAMNNHLATTDEDIIEQAERKRKQGQLQKNVVPKSLSHLLINSPPLKSEANYNSSMIPSMPLSSTPIQSHPLLKKPRLSVDHNSLTPQHHPTDDISFSPLQYPGYNQPHIPQIPVNTSQSAQITNLPPSIQSASSTASSTTGSIQQYNQQLHIQNRFVEVTPFNGRTNAMINNISVWTGESGGPPINTASLFDHNNQKNHSTYQNSLDNYLWNVPVEEFWTNNDDYGFLA